MKRPSPGAFRPTVVGLAFAFGLAGPARAGDIPVFQAQTVKPYQAQEVKPLAPAPAPPEAARGAASRSGAAASGLFGHWQTNVPGAVWQTPSQQQGWNTLHVAPGAQAGALVINPDGTYTWASYGGKQGRWRATGDREWPIVLDDTAERRQWRVGFDPKTGGKEIFVWDGSFSYRGKRAR